MEIGGSFNPIEAFLIGLEIEKAGVDLYLKGRDAASTPEMKKTFAELARFEQDHIDTFQKLIRENRENSDFLRPYDQDEVVEYISWLTKSDIFREIRDSHPRTPREILLLAVEAEKNSILLYTELKNISRDTETAEIFSRLLQEEKQHYILLCSELEKKETAG